MTPLPPNRTPVRASLHARLASRVCAYLLQVAAAFTFVAPAAAEPLPPTPKHQLFYQNLTAARLNPLGLQNMFELDWRHRLYDPGDSLIKSQNFWALSVNPILTPGLMRLGVGAKIQPLAILKLEVKWEYLNYFGNFDLVQSYGDGGADFSDSALKDGGDAGLNYATDGWQLTLDVEARAKVGPFVVRNRFKAAYLEVALKGGDELYYEQYFDLLLPKAGWFFTNDLDALVFVNKHLIVGARWAFMDVAYPDAALVDANAKKNAPTHRLGPLIAYTFFDDPGASFNKPTILLLVNWYLKHRWRTGEDVSQALPYFVLGFAFSGDL
ncbi:MAG: hypothetical protein KC492_20055, partial [Myxococcales bacterium]|nr:hypothetical protein [Myxococcales bacterium]